MQTFDLSHSLATAMPVYPGTDPVRVEPAATVDADGYRTTRLDLDSHAGTHVDAPAHLTDGPALDDLPVGRFEFTATAVDLRGQGDRAAIGVDAIRDGLAVDPGDVDLVAVATGWDSHWGSDRYFDHPYLTAEAADWLAARDCDLGVDTINPDPTPTENASDGEPDGFPVHEALFAEDRLIVENLREFDGLFGWFDRRSRSPRFDLHAYPLRFERADASPVRAVALAPAGEEQ